MTTTILTGFRPPSPVPQVCSFISSQPCIFHLERTFCTLPNTPTHSLHVNNPNNTRRLLLATNLPKLQEIEIVHHHEGPDHIHRPTTSRSVPAVGLVMAATQTQARDSWFGVRRHDHDASQSGVFHDKDGQADMSQAAEIIHASTAGPSDLPTHTAATSIFAPSAPPNSVHGSISCPNSGDPLCSTTILSAPPTEATMINPPRTADEALFSFGFVGHLNEKLGHVVEKVKEAAIPRREDEEILSDDGDTKKRFFAKRGDAVLESENGAKGALPHEPQEEKDEEEHSFHILPILDRVKRAFLEPEALDYEYAADQPRTEDDAGYEEDDEGDEMGRVRNDSILARVLSYLPIKATGRTAEFVTNTASTVSPTGPKHSRTAEFVSSASQSLSSVTHKATDAAKRALKDFGADIPPVHVQVQHEQDQNVKHQTEGKVEQLKEQAAHAAYHIKDEFDSAVDQAKDQLDHSTKHKRKRSDYSTRSWLGFIKRRRSYNAVHQMVQDAQQHVHEAENVVEQKASEAQQLLETKLKHAQKDAGAKVQEAKDAAQKKKHEFEQSAKDAAAALKKRQAQDEADRTRAAEEAKKQAHVVMDQKQHAKQEAKRLAAEQAFKVKAEAMLKKRQAKEEADRKAEEKRLAKLEAKRLAAEKATALKAEALLKKRESERIAAEKKQLEKREAERKSAADKAAKAEAAALRKRQDEQAAIEKEAAKKRAALEAKIKAEAKAHEKRVAAESKKHAEAIKAAQDKILAEEKAADAKKQQAEKAATEELKKRQDQEKKAAAAMAKKEAADAKKERQASEKLEAEFEEAIQAKLKVKRAAKA
ncbi:unnamed protein product [Mortierella alpina]